MLLGHGVYHSSRTLTKAFPKHSYPHSPFLPLHTPSSPSWNGTIFWKALSTSQTVLHVIISCLMLQWWPHLTFPLWDAVHLRGWDYVVWSWYRLQATQYLFQRCANLKLVLPKYISKQKKLKMKNNKKLLWNNLFVHCKYILFSC